MYKLQPKLLSSSKTAKQIIIVIIITTIVAVFVPIKPPFVATWVASHSETTEQGYPKVIKLGWFGSATVNDMKCKWRHPEGWVKLIYLEPTEHITISCPGYHGIDASIFTRSTTPSLSVHFGEFTLEIDEYCMEQYKTMEHFQINCKNKREVLHTYSNQKDIERRKARRKKPRLRSWDE